MVLAISADSEADGRNLAKQLGLDFQLLADPKLEVIDAYGVRHRNASNEGTDIARPATFVIDRRGIVRWVDLTDNWRIRVRPDRTLEELRKIP